MSKEKHSKDSLVLFCGFRTFVNRIKKFSESCGCNGHSPRYYERTISRQHHPSYDRIAPSTERISPVT